jgi:hypothetical protein
MATLGPFCAVTARLAHAKQALPFLAEVREEQPTLMSFAHHGTSPTIVVMAHSFVIALRRPGRPFDRHTDAHAPWLLATHSCHTSLDFWQLQSSWNGDIDTDCGKEMVIISIEPIFFLSKFEELMLLACQKCGSTKVLKIRYRR